MGGAPTLLHPPALPLIIYPPLPQHEYFFQHPLPCKPAEMPQHEAGHETATRRRERPPRPPRPPPKLAKIKVKFKAPQSPEAAAEASDDECEAWLNKMAAGDDTEDDGSEGDGAVARRRSRKRRSRLKLSTKAKSSRAA